MAENGIAGGGATPIGSMIKSAATALTNGGTKIEKDSDRDSAYLSHNIAPEKIGVDQSIQPNFEKFA